MAMPFQPDLSGHFQTSRSPHPSRFQSPRRLPGLIADLAGTASPSAERPIPPPFDRQKGARLPSTHSALKVAILTILPALLPRPPSWRRSWPTRRPGSRSNLRTGRRRGLLPGLARRGALARDLLARSAGKPSISGPARPIQQNCREPGARSRVEIIDPDDLFQSRWVARFVRQRASPICTPFRDRGDDRGPARLLDDRRHLLLHGACEDLYHDYPEDHR